LIGGAANTLDIPCR